MYRSHIDTLATRLVDPNPRHGRRDEGDNDNDDDDDDAIFAELEAEIENDDNINMREQGIMTLRQEIENTRKLKESQHGQYTEVFDEKEVMHICAKEPRCIVHFYHKNFKRCEIMDTHLAALAPKYFGTRFFRVLAENVPWLVTKLSIKVLPCVVSFIDGASKDRLVGFDELGGSDTFDTVALEFRLLNSGVIQKVPLKSLTSMIQLAKSNDDDGDFDL